MAPRRTRRPRKYQVPAVKRAFHILDCLNESSFGLTVREVSQLVKIPYSTAFYLLETMLGCDYVLRNEDTKKYSLGPKLFAFRDDRVARSALNLRALASGLLNELAEITDLTVHLATLENGEAVYIEKAEPRGFIRLNTWVGKRNSLYCTAVGKALIMDLSEDEVVRLCKPSTLIRRTDWTITTLEGLLKDLATARDRGYAIDDREDEIEGRCVAAPIFGATGTIVACVGLSGTLAQIGLNSTGRFGKLVREYADQISRRLGFLGDQLGSETVAPSLSVR